MNATETEIKDAEQQRIVIPGEAVEASLTGVKASVEKVYMGNETLPWRRIFG